MTCLIELFEIELFDHLTVCKKNDRIFNDTLQYLQPFNYMQKNKLRLVYENQIYTVFRTNIQIRSHKNTISLQCK